MLIAELTALSTVFLAMVGAAQVVILSGQRLQQRLDWAETYRRRWAELKEDWATVVFLGRGAEDYYQVAHHETLQKLRKASMAGSQGIASSWAQASVKNVCGMFSDLCSRVLQGQIKINEIYPIFGTELLRQGVPLRALLDNKISSCHEYGSIGPNEEQSKHNRLRNEMVTWLNCHDGIRRRCLILIDLLWAEAARLEDLPPYELAEAANAKLHTGHLNRARVRTEAMRLNGWWAWGKTRWFIRHLRHAEWQKCEWSRGLSEKRIKELDDEWTRRYLSS